MLFVFAMARCTVGKKCLLPFLCLTLFIIQLGLSLSYLPTIKLIQDIICKQSLGITFDDILPEEQCRDDAVQTELNLISMGNLISVTIGGTLSISGDTHRPEIICSNADDFVQVRL